MPTNKLMIFSGTGSYHLSRSICNFLKTPLRHSSMKVFPDGNTFVQVKENVRGQDIFIIQSTVYQTNDHFMELLFWIDAFKRASAATVTAVIPYFSYGKGDKKDEPRVSIRGRVCAEALEAVGCDRVVTMDLHAPQIQGFFRIPVDNLYGLVTLGERIKQDLGDDFVVVAADTGFAKEARTFARQLNVPVAIGVKQRKGQSGDISTLDVIGDVEGKTTLIVDDFTITGGTLVEGALNLMKKGALRVLAAVTHGVFVTGAMAKLVNSPLERIYTTDTIENRPESLSDKVEVVSVASHFALSIRQISRCESISEIFLK